MNKFTESLNKVKQFLKDAMDATAPVPAAAEAAPAAPVTVDYTLADGTTVVSIDKLEVGGMVTIAGSPVPDGDITLQDGTVISTVAGAITVITPKAAEEPTGEMSTPEQMRAYLEQFADTPPAAGATPDLAKTALILKAVFENVFSWEIRQAKEKADRDAAIAAYQTGFKKQTEALNAVVEMLQEFGEADLAKPAEETEENWEKMSNHQKFVAQRKYYTKAG